MSGMPAAERPTLQDIAPLLERLQRTPTEGATLSCLALRLVWVPPGDPAALDALRETLAAAADSDPDIPPLREICFAARRATMGETAQALTAYAQVLEQGGEEACAQLVVEAALRWGAEVLLPRALVQIHLLRARLYRKAARWADAAAAWAQVEELARQADDPWIRLRAQLGRVMLLRYRGNLPEAMRLAEDVATAAKSRGYRDIHALAANDLGTILETRGQHVDAAIQYWEAAQLAPADFEWLRFRALGNLGGMLRALGCMAGAGAALRQVEREALDWGDCTNAAIELLEVCSATGDMLGYRRVRQSLTDREPRMPPAMLVDYHYRLGLAAASLGEPGQNQEEWLTALRIAESHELGFWIIRLEAALRDGPPATPAPTDQRAYAVDLDVQRLLAGPSPGSLSLGAGLGVGSGACRIRAGRGAKGEQNQQQSE